jgi:alkaline phosphatase
MQTTRARFTKRALLLTVLVIVLVVSLFSATALGQSQLPVKNVILMISDGCGFNCFLATDYYQYGETGKQVYEKFPYKFAVSTFAAGGKYDALRFWTDFNYLNCKSEALVPFITESNMAASAMGTGVKTDLGVGINTAGTRVTNIVEIAESYGKATGVVSTQAFCEATPAGVSAHANDRKALKKIAEQQLRESKLDVVMGPYNPWYDNNGAKLTAGTFDDKNKLLWNQATWDQLVAGSIGNDADGDGTVENWSLIETRAQFQALATGPTPDRVAGVPQCGGDPKTGTGYTQFYRTGAANDAPFKTPLLQTSPTLTEMSLAALNVLDNDPQGFFLMIEGANIDYGNHFGWLGRAIEEQVEFNQAVEAMCAWIEANGGWDKNLLVITSDHETGAMWGPDAGKTVASTPGDAGVFVPIVNNGKGNLPAVTYYNHRPLYETPAAPFFWHTNALVPLFAKGSGAELFASQVEGVDPVRGRYIDNTDIFKVMNQCILNGSN